MKYLLCAALALFSYCCHAQHFRASQLCNEQIKLNGGIRSQFGGLSRNFIPLHLPEGTTHVAISVTVSQNDEHISGYDLTTNLVSMFATGNVLSAVDAVNTLQGKPGTGVLDIVLFDNEHCAAQYLRKEQLSCNPVYFRLNSVGGIYQCEVDKYSSKYWLCFRNPSEINAVYFKVEATAITPENEATPTPDLQPNYLKARYSK